MCGFAGFVDRRVRSYAHRSTLAQMLSTLRHRGPDDEGIFEAKDVGVFLGHRRLSIIDLSAHGKQPMESRSGRFTLALNGEIYNFLEIRKELEAGGVGFRGHSDTEVFLGAVEAWGIETALKKSTGMFALALWDSKDRQIYLARDRAGEKPLYYGWIGEGVFAFASELKALRGHPEFNAEIDRTALSQFLQFSYVPEPKTIYTNCHKLPPGGLLRLSVMNEKLEINSFWSFAESVDRAKARPYKGSLEDAEVELEGRLTKIINQQMISDVPLGAFLSGGIDSSLIVALMQKQSRRPVKTFTIGFDDQAFDESASAEKVANALGTEHTTLIVSPKQSLDLIPRLPKIYDEPFADSSQIPTYLVAELAKTQVTVALSGDGGDEVFGGYNRYFLGSQISHRLNRIPAFLRRGVAGGMDQIPPARWDQIFGVIARLSGSRFSLRQPGLKMQKLAQALRTRTPFELYEVLTSIWPQADSAMKTFGGASRDPWVQNKFPKTSLHFTEFMMAYDFLTYLVDDILVKVDRAGMAVSLESRIPFLDHDLIEWSWSLPTHFKVQPGNGKVILKRLLAKYLKPDLFLRPKMGFGIPLAAWTRRELRPWAEELISEKRLRDDGYFNSVEVSRKWREHLAGRRDWSHAIWNVLMFQAWLDEQKSFAEGRPRSDQFRLPVTAS